LILILLALALPDVVARLSGVPSVEGGVLALQPNATVGTLLGHVRLMGPLPGNPVIRMGRDPGCAALNRGKQVVQATVAATADGSLANVFIELEGTFAPTPVPSTPVVIEQRGCLYEPRVAVVRVGQQLEVRNGDAVTHNVHSVSASTNAFNVGQSAGALPFRITPRIEERMVQLKCDVHSWMTAFLAVVDHPYTAVSAADGTFRIANVPPGSYFARAWHERYGALAVRVRVTARATATLDFAYPGTGAVAGGNGGRGIR
jgi:plastocyanin